VDLIKSLDLIQINVYIFTLTETLLNVDMLLLN